MPNSNTLQPQISEQPQVLEQPKVSDLTKTNTAPMQTPTPAPAPTSFWQSLGAGLLSPASIAWHGVSAVCNAVGNYAADWLNEKNKMIESLKEGKCVILEVDGENILLESVKVNDQWRLGLVGSKGRTKIYEEPLEQKVSSIVDKLGVDAHVVYESRKVNKVREYKEKLEQAGLIKRTGNSITLCNENGEPIKTFKRKIELNLYLRYQLKYLADEAAYRKQLAEADKPKTIPMAALMAITLGGTAIAPIALEAGAAFAKAAGKIANDIYNVHIGPPVVDTASVPEPDMPTPTSQADAPAPIATATAAIETTPFAATATTPQEPRAFDPTTECDLKNVDGVNLFEVDAPSIPDAVAIEKEGSNGNAEIAIASAGKIYVTDELGIVKSGQLKTDLPTYVSKNGVTVINDDSPTKVLDLQLEDVTGDGKVDLTVCKSDEVVVIFDIAAQRGTLGLSSIDGSNGKKFPGTCTSISAFNNSILVGSSDDNGAHFIPTVQKDWKNGLPLSEVTTVGGTDYHCVPGDGCGPVGLFTGPDGKLRTAHGMPNASLLDRQNNGGAYFSVYQQSLQGKEVTFTHTPVKGSVTIIAGADPSSQTGSGVDGGNGYYAVGAKNEYPDGQAAAGSGFIYDTIQADKQPDVVDSGSYPDGTNAYRVDGLYSGDQLTTSVAALPKSFSASSPYNSPHGRFWAGTVFDLRNPTQFMGKGQPNSRTVSQFGMQGTLYNGPTMNAQVGNTLARSSFNGGTLIIGTNTNMVYLVTNANVMPLSSSSGSATSPSDSQVPSESAAPLSRSSTTQPSSSPSADSTTTSSEQPLSAVSAQSSSKILPPDSASTPIISSSVAPPVLSSSIVPHRFSSSSAESANSNTNPSDASSTQSSSKILPPDSASTPIISSSVVPPVLSSSVVPHRFSSSSAGSTNSNANPSDASSAQSSSKMLPPGSASTPSISSSVVPHIFSSSSVVPHIFSSSSIGSANSNTNSSGVSSTQSNTDSKAALSSSSASLLPGSSSSSSRPMPTNSSNGSQANNSHFPTWAIGLIAGGSLLLLITLVVLIYMGYRHNKRRNYAEIRDLDVDDGGIHPERHGPACCNLVQRCWATVFRRAGDRAPLMEVGVDQFIA